MYNTCTVCCFILGWFSDCMPSTLISQWDSALTGISVHTRVGSACTVYTHITAGYDHASEHVDNVLSLARSLTN